MEVKKSLWNHYNFEILYAKWSVTNPSAISIHRLVVGKYSLTENAARNQLRPID